MFVFGVSGIVSKVLKMLVFPVWGAFLGWLVVVHLGLEGLGVFVFLVFAFFVLLLFLFCLLCYWVLWLDVVVLFFCVFVVFFCFLEGLRVR